MNLETEPEILSGTPQSQVDPSARPVGTGSDNLPEGDLAPAVERKRGPATLGPAQRGNGAALDLRPEAVRPAPSELAAVLDEITAILRRVLVVEDECAPETMALWAAFTHAFPAATHNPRLHLKSRTAESGKGVAAQAMLRISHEGWIAGNASPAFIFRKIDGRAPRPGSERVGEKSGITLILDEVDTFMQDDAAFTNLINNGWTPEAAYVGRCEEQRGKGGTEFGTREFHVWAPLILCGIGEIAPYSAASRCIPIRMKRADRQKGERKARLTHAVKGELHRLGKKLGALLAPHFDALRDADPDLPLSLSYRQCDNWRLLVAIADLAGGHWPDTARRAAEILSSQLEPEPSLLDEVRALAREYFEDHPGLTYIKVEELAYRCESAALVPSAYREPSRWLSGVVFQGTGIRARRIRVPGRRLENERIWVYDRSDLCPDFAPTTIEKKDKESRSNGEREAVPPVLVDQVDQVDH